LANSIGSTLSLWSATWNRLGPTLVFEAKETCRYASAAAKNPAVVPEAAPIGSSGRRVASRHPHAKRCRQASNSNQDRQSGHTRGRSRDPQWLLARLDPDTARLSTTAARPPRAVNSSSQCDTPRRAASRAQASAGTSSNAVSSKEGTGQSHGLPHIRDRAQDGSCLGRGRPGIRFLTKIGENRTAPTRPMQPRHDSATDPAMILNQTPATGRRWAADRVRSHVSFGAPRFQAVVSP